MIDHHAVPRARDSTTMRYRRGRRDTSVAKHAAMRLEEILSREAKKVKGSRRVPVVPERPIKIQ